MESALKAFNCLMEDGHSGMSIGFTKAFLNRLIDGKPLTPIEDTDDIWEFSWEDDGVKTYQCTRMSSLFKDEYSDGTVKYHDVDRVICYEVSSPDVSYSSGFVRKTIDEMFPITMPYWPKDNPYKVYVEEFLTDPKMVIMTLWVFCILEHLMEKRLISVDTSKNRKVDLLRLMKTSILQELKLM